jgi:DNA polymerase-3 subunit delta'
MFDELIGNERAKEILRRMLRQKRVPGALLFAGEGGLGKSLFALELARALNCREPRGVEACGACASCAKVGRFQFPASDDKDEFKKVIWGEHRDVGLIRPYNRTIYINAIRDLERESNFRPFEGRARVFIVEGADALNKDNEPSANALLKTLEEAPPTTHIILVTSRPASLLPTIRSRCQTVRFAPLAVEEVEQYLVKTRARAGDEARLAARLSGGRPGVAREVNLDTYRGRRDAMLGVVEALAEGSDRARLLRAAEELGDAKNKEEYEPRLDVLELLIRDLWMLALGVEGAGAVNVVNEDLRERLARLASGLRPARAARWLASVEELRAQLTVNVNRRVATDALFLSMASD